MGNHDQQTVLIVDDEPANLTVLSDILLPYFSVRAANSGESALRIARIEPCPDLILLDVMMPHMDGFEVLSRLRQDAQTSEIPVIFITALSDALDEERGLKLGAVDYINKPINGSIVLARTRTHMALKRATDELRDKNDWLEREVAKRLREVHLVQDVSLCALAELAETRDNETGNHILRTQGFVHVLARYLSEHGPYRDELADGRVDLFAKAAPLHDIGKVGIPDRILLKPGKLTDAEFEIMKTHAAIGGDAIDHALRKAMLAQGDADDELANESLDFLSTAQLIAAGHHERWDGNGYPRRLAGTDIPLAARIMAVADVFDALINKRVYKPAFTMAESTEIIENGRGSQFDPVVVDAFLENRAEFERIAQSLADHEDESDDGDREVGDAAT